MSDVVLLLLAASGTALATGLGGIPVFVLEEGAARLTPLLLGFAAGVMGVAAISGLLIRATEEGSAAEVCAGLAAGSPFWWWCAGDSHPMSSSWDAVGPARGHPRSSS